LQYVASAPFCLTIYHVSPFRTYMKSLQVLVADHQPIFVEGVRSVLSLPFSQLNCQITGVARNVEQILGYLKEYRIDIILLDPSIPQSEGADFIASLRQQYERLRILALPTQTDVRSVKQMMQAGANGCILKSASKEELRRAIVEINDGLTYLGRGVETISNERKSGDADSNSEQFAKKFNLTRREVEIIRYIGLALTNREIGEKLFISDQTVSVHRKNIMRKLRVNSTANLVRIVFEHHLTETSAAV
jgi:DNA-binding NarL/FixJ family response regulator